MAIVKKKRGRPRKDDPNYNPGGLRNWQPKTWKPMYEEIVRLFYSGMSQQVVAEKYGITSQHVNNIVNSVLGRTVRRVMLEQIKKQHDEDITKRFENLRSKAMVRIAEVIENDELAATSPFSMMNASMKLLEKTGDVLVDKANGNTNVTNNTIIDNRQYLVEIKDGLDDLRKATLIHAEPVPRDVISKPVGDQNAKGSK